MAAAQASGGVVVALGGDGTINTVAAAANRAQVAMGVVARGTFNLFAGQQGLAEDPRQALNDIVDALDQAWLRPVQLGLVNGQPFLVNASLGVYPELLQDRATPMSLASALWAQLSNEQNRQRLRRRFIDMHHDLMRNTASQSAHAVMELLAKNGHL